MINAEAIEDIRNNILPIVGGKSLVMAIEALEKQIPQKPERIKNMYGEGSTAVCPVCRVFNGDGKTAVQEWQNFCPQCGQALDWEDEK